MTIRVTKAVIAATLLSTLASPLALADSEMIAKGKKYAFDRKLGNCLSCHMIVGGESPGNIGPPLIAMKARFPNKSDLRTQIWDSTSANANSMMPPFGKHGILTEAQIDAVTEYIHTL